MYYKRAGAGENGEQDDSASRSNNFIAGPATERHTAAASVADLCK